jgi:4-hydroxy-4-methyl-2-oxoglutarate aldolase
MGSSREPAEAAHANATDGHQPLPPDIFDAILQFDTCTIANAIERFGVRLRNEGFTRPGLRCVTGGTPRLLGYAATCRVRSANPPMVGSAYVDRTDWWEDIGQLPSPRIAVIEDLDAGAIGASTVGEVHAAILKAFHCNGVITNGAVRDLPGVGRLQFPMFAGAVSVSHAYMHIVEYGAPVEIFGLAVRPGDLLYADCHGVISIPLEIAARVPEAAAAIRDEEQAIVDLCQSADFSLDRLLNAVHRKE